MGDMDFFRSKAGIAVAVICLAVIAAVIWFVVGSENHRTVPEGTLVWECSREIPGAIFCDEAQSPAEYGRTEVSL